MIMPFNFLKYFSSGKISFFLFATRLWYKPEKLMFFFQKSWPVQQWVNKKRVVIPRENIVLLLEFALFGN